jgi:hypothetical protein
MNQGDSDLEKWNYGFGKNGETFREINFLKWPRCCKIGLEKIRITLNTTTGGRHEYKQGNP